MKKVGSVFILIAAIAFAVSAVLLLAGLFRSGTVSMKHQRLSLSAIFCAVGVGALLITRLLVEVRKIYVARKSASRRGSSNSGSVLLMVLIILGMASGLLLHLQFNARMFLEAADRAFQTERLRIAAADTARMLLQGLADDENLLADYDGEKWSVPVEIVYPDDIVVDGRVVDAQSRFDMNNLAVSRSGVTAVETSKFLRAIMRQCGMPHSSFQLAALQDWVDSNQDGQYESAIYMKGERPYRCPDTVIEDISELKWIKGWEHIIFNQPREEGLPALSDCLSSLPGDHREPVPVNLNTAPRDVLLAMTGGNSELVRLLISMRKNTPLTSLTLLESQIGAKAMDSLRPFLDVKSRFFRVFAEADDGKKTVSLSALVQRDSNGDVSVLRWVY